MLEPSQISREIYQYLRGIWRRIRQDLSIKTLSAWLSFSHPVSIISILISRRFDTACASPSFLDDLPLGVVDEQHAVAVGVGDGLGSAACGVEVGGKTLALALDTDGRKVVEGVVAKRRSANYCAFCRKDRPPSRRSRYFRRRRRQNVA